MKAAGRNRNKRMIQSFLDSKGLCMSDIQRLLGMKGHSVVVTTIAGKGNNRRVLRLLKDMGCPQEHLDLPQDLQGQDNA